MVSPSFPPDQFGGLEVSFRNLYHRARAHHEVRLLTGWRRARSLVPPEAHVVELSGCSPQRSWFRMGKALRQQLNRFHPDVILTTHATIPHTSVPTLCLFHEAYAEASSIQDKLRMKLLSYRTQHLELLVTSTATAAQKLKEQGFPEDRIRVIPNGIDLNFFSPMERQESSSFNILHPARIKLEKGQHLSIDAVARLKSRYKKNCVLTLSGASHSDRYLDRLRVQAYQQPVIFAPDVPELCPYYQQSDVLVYSSMINEGVPNTLLEGMACGKPVIWFDLPTVREATGGQGIAIPPGSVDKMRDAIEYLYDNPEACKKLGEEARRYIQTKHSWEGIWHQYEETLSSIHGPTRWL
jgi:glycosyltransferase involved in cell wall biosynthesis